MDPDENLKELRELLRTLIDRYDAAPSYNDLDGTFAQDAARACDLMQALDEWLIKGGVLPREWQTLTRR